MIVKLVQLVLLTVAVAAGPSEGSVLPPIDRPRSVLADMWPDRWFPDPFRVLEQIPVFGGTEKDAAWLTPPAKVDWKETPEGHVIVVDVPGLRKEELKIELDENRVLRVVGERKREEEKKEDHWHRVERSYGKFYRQLRLPENVDLDSVKAKLENGVLTVNLKKLSPDEGRSPRIVGIEEGHAGEAELSSSSHDPKKQEL